MNEPQPLSAEEEVKGRTLAQKAFVEAVTGDPEDEEIWAKFQYSFRPSQVLRLFATLDAERAQRVALEAELAELKAASQWLIAKLEDTDMWGRFAEQAFPNRNRESVKSARVLLALVDEDFAAEVREQKEEGNGVIA